MNVRKLKKAVVAKPVLKVLPTAASGAKRATNGAPTPVPVVKSSRVSLELIKPDAKQVFVAGSFNEWQPERAPLVPSEDGRWIGDLAIGPGRYEYLFVVDGQWMPDPNAKETVENPFGGHNSVLTVKA